MTVINETLPHVAVGGFILARDANGVFHVRSASKAFYRFLDLERVEPARIWDALSEMVHTADRARFEAAFDKPDDGQEISWQGRLVIKAEIRIVAIDVQPDVSGTADTTWVGILQDLSGVKDLNRSFVSVLEAAQAVPVRYDILRGENQWSPGGRVLALDGNTPKFTMPRAEWERLVHPEDREEVLRIMGEMERGVRQQAMLLYRRMNADGTWNWQRVVAGIDERDAAGKPTSLLGVSFNVTADMEQLERVKAEASALSDALEESKAILARTAYEITENIPIGTFTVTLSPNEQYGRFGFLSRRFLEIMGQTAEAMRAGPIQAFPKIHPEDHGAFFEAYLHAVKNKLPFKEEARLVGDERTGSVRIEAIPRQKDDGSWIWEGVITDITEEKRQAAALLKAHEQLIEATRITAGLEERQRLLQDIHDGFGNTLAIGKIRLRGGDVPVTEAVEVIEDCLADLRILINSLDAEGESLWSVLGSLLERIAARARHLSLDLTWDLDASRRIYLRPRQMLQAARIVQEAVANAIRHSGAQAIHVAVTGGEQDGTGQIAIRDNGQGFDPKGHYRGRGLENMRQRANAEGWKLLFQAGTDDKGTQVTLDLGTG